jgi:hypothetical protein
MSADAGAALERACRRLDRLDLYPRPVRAEHVRVVTVPWFFRLPWFRRFDGYAFYGAVLLRRPVGETSDDLVTHELCHIWQLQHHPIRMPLSYLRYGYRNNPYEIEAREAARSTRYV